METYRSTFTTVRRTLDYDLYPMRLWEKAKKLGVWDPADVDFSQDREDWRRLSDRERDLLLRLTVQFLAGEESVTLDLLPLLHVVADEGRIEEEMFLTSYLWEEAKHVEGFARFLSQVAQATGDLDRFFTHAYRRHFYEEQPRALHRLRDDTSPAAVADASVTYQMVTEGILAETGYHAYYVILKQRGIMPGIQQLVQLVQRDEARHIGYGVFLLSRLIAAHGDVVWDVVEARMNALLSLSLDQVAQTLEPYGDDIPFGITVDDFVQFALDQFGRRYAVLERARGRSLEEILYGRGE